MAVAEALPLGPHVVAAVTGAEGTPAAPTESSHNAGRGRGLAPGAAAAGGADGGCTGSMGAAACKERIPEVTVAEGVRARINVCSPGTVVAAAAGTDAGADADADFGLSELDASFSGLHFGLGPALGDFAFGGSAGFDLSDAEFEALLAGAGLAPALVMHSDDAAVANASSICNSQVAHPTQPDAWASFSLPVPSPPLNSMPFGEGAFVSAAPGGVDPAGDGDGGTSAADSLLLDSSFFASSLRLSEPDDSTFHGRLAPSSGGAATGSRSGGGGGSSTADGVAASSRSGTGSAAHPTASSSAVLANAAAVAGSGGASAGLPATTPSNSGDDDQFAPGSDDGTVGDDDDDADVDSETAFEDTCDAAETLTGHRRGRRGPDPIAKSGSHSQSAGAPQRSRAAAAKEQRNQRCVASALGTAMGGFLRLPPPAAFLSDFSVWRKTKSTNRRTHL